MNGSSKHRRSVATVFYFGLNARSNVGTFSDFGRDHRLTRSNVGTVLPFLKFGFFIKKGIHHRGKFKTVATLLRPYFFSKLETVATLQRGAAA